jgi:hypothetical protein
MFHKDRILLSKYDPVWSSAGRSMNWNKAINMPLSNFSRQVIILLYFRKLLEEPRIS